MISFPVIDITSTSSKEKSFSPLTTSYDDPISFHDTTADDKVTSVTKTFVTGSHADTCDSSVINSTFVHSLLLVSEQTVLT